MEDITEVSFVTKGAGNLILRQTLNLPPELQTFQEKMRIRNIVEINPVIKSSFLCDLLSKFRIFRLIGGPMLEEMTEKKLKKSSQPAESAKFAQNFFRLQNFKDNQPNFGMLPFSCPRESLQKKRCRFH